MIKVKQGEYGKVVEAELDITVRAYLDDGDIREEITEEEANKLIKYQIDELAGSNTGSELLANANFKLIP